MLLSRWGLVCLKKLRKRRTCKSYVYNCPRSLCHACTCHRIYLYNLPGGLLWRTFSWNRQPSRPLLHFWDKHNLDWASERNPNTTVLKCLYVSSNFSTPQSYKEDLFFLIVLHLFVIQTKKNYLPCCLSFFNTEKMPVPENLIF